MIQKICPICSKTMEFSHYCRNCRSWVKQPYIQNVNYYLNERHPDHERNCSYHSEGTGNAASGSTAFTGASAGNTAGWYIQNFPDGNEKGKGPWGVLGLISVVTLAITLVFFVTYMYHLFWKREADEMFGQEWNVQFDEETEGVGNWYGEDDWMEDNFRELEDDEVIAAGIACSGDGHFPVSGLEMEILLGDVLEEYGFGDSQIQRYSYNEEYSDEYGNVTSTYFSSYVDFDFGEDWDEEVGGYLELDYDTATGELHGVSLALRDKEILIALSLDILRLIEEKSGQREGIWSDSVKRDMPGVIEIKSGYVLIAGDLSVRGYYYDGDYCFSIDFIQ